MTAFPPEVAEKTLRVADLSIDYGDPARPLHAVRNVSLTIARGEAYGLIGESGSGKSTLAFAIMGHTAGGRVTSGSIAFCGQNLLQLAPRAWQAIRGNKIAMVYQDPMNALNPAFRLGEQVAEVLRHHSGLSRAAAWTRAVELFRLVHLPDPKGIASRYPHQISGGQQQRVVIAMAIACDIELLIMDEPTTGLDITTEARILALIAELRQRLGIAILFISHNLRVVAQVCDRVGVLYAGQLVEEGPAAEVLERPRHPYAIGLKGALTPAHGEARRRLQQIPGRLPDLRSVPPGCIFAARCGHAVADCITTEPAIMSVGVGHASRCFFSDLPVIMLVSEPMRQASPTDHRALPALTVVDLEYAYAKRRMLPFFGSARDVNVLDHVTLAVRPGETLGIVGESGSGKSTLARCIAGLRAPSRGSIRLGGERLEARAGQRSQKARRSVQIVFQNPEGALNPVHTVGEIVGRPLRLYGMVPKDQVRQRTIELLEMVNLEERYLERLPGELSGGEKQRVNIARVLGASPQIVICDEPTSALDISVQASVLNMLVDLRRAQGMSYIFITHDLGVVRYISERIAVMYQGTVVETGLTEDVFNTPFHPYTEMLLGALPGAVRVNRQIDRTQTAPAAAAAWNGKGCPFAERCPRKVGSVCDEIMPPVRHGLNERLVACHIAVQATEAVIPEGGFRSARIG
jgi:peptide/nickel transport system ATP-binding protein